MTSDACGACLDGIEPPFPFTMAFQPIVDLDRRQVFAYEALVRGINGEGAGHILAQVTDDNRYAFDQSCRIKAIELAAHLGLGGSGIFLSINFLPGAVYQPETCIRATIEAARRTGFPVDQLIFEVTESENIRDKAHLKGIFAEYRRRGFKTAIDDFGAGYAGLTLLSEFQPDILKIDMELTRGIDQDPIRRSIVGAVITVCRDLRLTVVAEGIETAAEMATLRDLGISRQQGYLFARPGLESLPQPVFP